MRATLLAINTGFLDAPAAARPGTPTPVLTYILEGEVLAQSRGIDERGLELRGRLDR